MAEIMDARVSDADLVAACRSGAPEAWNALVERYARYVSAIATQAFRLAPQDAEDVFQTVFMRVFERLDSLRSDSAIRPWVGQLTRNCCLDVLRASGRLVPVAEVEERIADPRSLLRARRELPDDQRCPLAPRRHDREQDLALPRASPGRARPMTEENTPLPRRVDMVIE